MGQGFGRETGRRESLKSRWVRGEGRGIAAGWRWAILFTAGWVRQQRRGPCEGRPRAQGRRQVSLTLCGAGGE